MLIDKLRRYAIFSRRQRAHAPTAFHFLRVSEFACDSAAAERQMPCQSHCLGAMPKMRHAMPASMPGIRSARKSYLHAKEPAMLICLSS